MARPDSYESPPGIAVHPWINKADIKYNANGVFHTHLIMDGDLPEVQKFMAQIKEASEAQFLVETKGLSAAEKKKWTVYLPFEDELDADSGEPTGRVLFNFKRNWKVKIEGEEKELRVYIYDSVGNAIPEADIPNIYGGSVLKAVCTFRAVKVPGTHQAGIKLDMFGVQVIKLQQSGGGKSPFSKAPDADPDEIEGQGGYVFKPGVKGTAPKAPAEEHTEGEY